MKKLPENWRDMSFADQIAAFMEVYGVSENLAQDMIAVELEGGDIVAVDE